MNPQTSDPHNVENDGYDAHIMPAETAARKKREGDAFKEIPGSPDDGEKIDTAGGYTMDSEGLINNYAVEPEMYYEVPGDLKAQEEAAKAARAQELAQVNQTDETGKLTEDSDSRGKGPGVI